MILDFPHNCYCGQKPCGGGGGGGGVSIKYPSNIRKLNNTGHKTLAFSTKQAYKLRGGMKDTHNEFQA